MTAKPTVASISATLYNALSKGQLSRLEQMTSAELRQAVVAACEEFKRPLGAPSIPDKRAA